MHPTATRPNRSSIQSSVPPTSTPSSILHPQQQQILYGPVPNPTLSLQPCGTSLHPSCIYPGARRNASLTNPVPLPVQGKSSRWPPKNKLARNPEYCQQQQQQQRHIQQQLSYNPKSLVLFDQTTNTTSLPAPTASFLIASSTYTHGSFSGDQYNSGIALVPQAYFKSPDVQTFCVVQDRQSIQQQEQLSHGSYYNVSSTNTCNLQTVNANPSYQFHNSNPYVSPANYSNQVTSPVQTTQPNQIFSNPPVNLVFGNLQRDKPATPSTFDASTLKCARNRLLATNDSQIPSVAAESYSEWPSPSTASANNLLDIKPSIDDAKKETTTAYSSEKAAANVPTKTQEEHYSDESSASFDFTIEAEKMVSALCNTSANDIGKEDTKNDKSDSAPLFNGAGDTISNKNTWFTDFCVDYGTSTSIAVQTDGPNVDRTQYSELLRKVVYWGCTEAEVVLSNTCKTSSKFGWLRNLSAATKTAVTKSSTCFPIFAGDRVFIGDLINALLRISNGWLILDNYLNKQHYPSLDDKLNRELIRCFQQWEENTHELLNQIVQTFLKLEENSDASCNVEQKSESFGTSFPGDVSAYTSNDLFDPSSSTKQDSANKRTDQDSPFNVAQLASTGSLRSFGQYDVNQERQSSQKETKLRSKWTITENVTTIDSTKFVPDVFPGRAESGAQANGRFRLRGSSSSRKTDTSAQSLNAEFFHLRSKVLTESNQESSKQWTFKEKKEEFPESGSSAQENIDSIFRLQRQLDDNYETNYAQKCLSRMESSFLNPSISLQSMYFASNNDAEHFYPNYAICPSYTVDYGHKHLKNFDQNHGSRTNVDLIYVGKSSTSQLQLAAVPKDKMTLLSQIEPSIPEKSSEEMTANLSAWFASMRNSDDRQMSFINLADDSGENGTARAARHEPSKDLGNCIRQLQIDANRQFQTLQNMQSIQAAPWNAYNLINNRIQVQQVPEEYDSSEDVRVYMKPGSYNVPKKRHQRKSNRRLYNSRSLSGESSTNHRNRYISKEKTFCAATSSTPLPRPVATSVSSDSTGATTKLPFLTSPIVPASALSLENSPRILKRSDIANYTVSEDVTWKAACASAEILLEALNVKDAEAKKKEIQLIEVAEEPDGVKENDHSDTVSQLVKIISDNQEKLEESFVKTLKDDNDAYDGVSSYEASEDESGSTSRLSPNEISQLSENKNGSSKMNVKTDSWLIRTLNNVSMANKQKRQKNFNRDSSESSNSSVTENKQTAVIVSSVTNGDADPTTTMKNVEQSISLEKSSPTSKETDRVAGKATYSETLRRCASLSASFSEKKESCKKSKLNSTNVSTISARKCQRKDLEKSYRLLHHKLCKCPGKKTTRNCGTNDAQETSQSLIGIKHGRKKENAECIELLDEKNDRGWSVWYSSKRKQSLSPLALSKLEMIHQTVWQMEEAEIFKCPSSRNNNQSSASAIEDYCKVIKSPMFLETVEYKLKNRIYHKVEHAVRDFRRIVHNSKLYHKNDHDRVKTIETLSKKIEGLFEEHFGGWDFGNVSGSPRESSPVFHRFKTTGQKSVTRCYSNSKKSPSPSITESI